MNIIEMAEQAGVAFGADDYPEIWQTYMNVGKKEIETFALLVAAHELEECAKMVDHILKEGGGTYGDAIRARSKA